ncbi:MAG: SAV_2336 N-terminal domain-related protein, partial [Streptosporangiaceae bacterium]
MESAPESDSAYDAGDAVPAGGSDEAGRTSGTDAEIPLHLGGDAGGAGHEDVSAPVPATEVAFGVPRPIRDPLTLPMALRRLRRIRTPGPIMTVDIDATVEATADAGGRLMTVLTRPPQRTLDLALVVDGAPSMDIWAGTFDELERLLAQTGAFRSVSRWTLRLSGDGAQLQSRDNRAQPPRRLIDPSGRRLVLLATDGRDEAWYSAAPWNTLDAWCAAMPTALLQMLPQHYWATTAVGDPYLTATALRPAAPNSQYVHRLAWWADDPGGVPLPVVTLSPQAMETWAHVVAGGNAWTTGITAVPPALESAPPPAGSGADPLMLVNDFRSRASRGAQRLARILASTETLSMPLIEVLQDRLAPETGVLERAEVLASGMLTQTRAAGGKVLFHYLPGIPEILRRGATTFDEWDTYAAVSQYLEDRHRLGGPLHALITDPAGTAELDAAEAPFGALHESLAVRLGLRDSAASRTTSPTRYEPSEGEDPAPGEIEHALRDEAGSPLLDEAGSVLTSEAAADDHDQVDLRKQAQAAAFEVTAGEDELAAVLAREVGRDNDDPRGHGADLDTAVDAGQQVVQATPAGHPSRARHLSNLGNALQARYEHTEMTADLDAAISCFREAVQAAPVGHPGLASYQSNLGNALQARYERTGDLADLEAATDLIKRLGVATLQPAAPDHSAGALPSSTAQMSVRAVDKARSRIVLFGTPAYADPGLPDVPVIANNVADLAAAFTDPDLGGFDLAHCVTVPPDAGVAEVGDLLLQAATEAEDLLLFYYSGHGKLWDGEYYLCLAGTRPDRLLPFTALSFEAVRGAFLESRARNRVIILDSSYSGRAIGQTLGDDEVLSQLEVAGTYTLTSASAAREALFLQGELHTAFTERLLHLLRTGLPEAGELLSLGDIYRALRRQLHAEALPEPQY